MSLSPSVVQLFSMKNNSMPSITTPTASDSGIESIKSGRSNRQYNKTGNYKSNSNTIKCGNIINGNIKTGSINNNNNNNNIKKQYNNTKNAQHVQNAGNAGNARNARSAGNAQNKNCAKLLKTRASSLSPTKNIINTPNHINNNNNTYNQHTSPKTAKKMKQLPPRFSMKKQVSAPVGAASPNRPIISSFQPTAINTPSEPTFRNKKITSTAMTKKFPNNTKNNNTPYNSGNTNSKTAQQQQLPIVMPNHGKQLPIVIPTSHENPANLSDSGSRSDGDSGSLKSVKSGKSVKSNKSNKSVKSNKSEGSKSEKSAKSSSTKRYVRTANFVNAGNPNNQHQRQRNNDSFCGTVFKDEMWAGSAAPPEATALPKPPTDWIKNKQTQQNLKDMMTGLSDNDAATVFLEDKCSEKINKKASANIAKTTTKPPPPLANSVQKMFASFNPLVSTTA